MDLVITVNDMIVLALSIYALSIATAISGGNSRIAMKTSFTLTALASLILMPIPFIYAFILRQPIRMEVPFFGTYIPLYIDALSAILIFVIAVLTLASSIYSLSYMDYYSKLGMFGFFAAMFSLFSVSMLLVVTVNSFLWFLFMWEVMTLASYFLINWEYVEESVRKAAWKYFISMHFLSTLPLIIAIAIVYTFTGVDSITEARTYISALDPRILALLYALFLIGFGAKAGIVPLHFWLPDAHPAAPSNVSALLSGAMIKVAVYGLLRFCVFLLPLNLYVGTAIAIVGTVSLTVGTLCALKQTDSKRLLAYHSVGQMGYIWLGLGSGIVLAATNNPLAIVGFVAGLYHLVNHAVFKGLLFLSAGSILYRLKTRDLNVMGGLAKFMPLTAVFTLIAVLSIAGVPPFNGFVSKWLIYEATFLSNNGLLVFCGVMALFISAATLASFIKFYTAAFGGTPRVKVEEVPVPMLVGKAILATFCIIMGVIPMSIVPLLIKASIILAPSVSIAELMVSPILVSVANVSNFMPPLLLLFVAIFMLFGFALALPKVSIVSPWNCGQDVELKHYKLLALHYYRTYEEHIHTLYRVCNQLSESFGGAIIRAAYVLAKVSDAIATALSRSGFMIFRSISCIALSLAMFSDSISTILTDKVFRTIIRALAQFLQHHIREFYVDEAVVVPITKALNGIARFLAWTVMRTDIVTFMSYSALFILIVSLIIMSLVIGMMIGFG